MKKNNSPLLLTDWDIQCMAYHEAGHAVCSYFLPEREKLIKITINPSDEAFGMVRTAQRLHHNETEVSLMSTIATFLAGRIAEEKFLGIKTTSCIHDLASAQSIAIDMVVKFGMGKRLGFGALNDTEHFSAGEHHRKQIIQDVRDILDEAAQDADRVLGEHESAVISLAGRLLKKNTLSINEITRFFENIKTAHGNR